VDVFALDIHTSSANYLETPTSILKLNSLDFSFFFFFHLMLDLDVPYETNIKMHFRIKIFSAFYVFFWLIQKISKFVFECEHC